MSESGRERTVHILYDHGRESWPGESREPRIFWLSDIFQPFPPAAVIFTGIGILFSVSVIFSRTLVTQLNTSGYQGCQGSPRCNH